MSERYPPDLRAQLPVSSFHGERNLPRSRRSSPYFRDEMNLILDDSYSREARYISDHRIRERSLSPRDRSHLTSQRGQEPDLRDYLIASQHGRKLSDFDRQGPNYTRAYRDYDIVNRTSDRKYDRDIDKARMDQESMDLRNRELLSRRDYRDEKYLFDSGRDRRFSDLRDEYDSRRGRYSPDRRDQLYLPEARREDHLDYRDKLYLIDSRREKLSSDFREDVRLPDVRRGWPSPEGRRKEISDSSRLPHPDQEYRYFSETNRRWLNGDEVRAAELERERRRQEQSHQDRLLAPQRDLKSPDPRYIDPSTEHWRDRYPEGRFERSINDSKGMLPINDGWSINGLNNQGRTMDYTIKDNWNKGNLSPWIDKESFPNMNAIEADDNRSDSLSSVDYTYPMERNPSTPFVTGDALPRIEMEGAPLPRLTVLIQYLYNFNQPLIKAHVDHIKRLILRLWTEEKMKRRQGLWLPKFLECIRRHNGLAIVCADRRSFRWLLDRKLKGVKGFLFAASNAETPIRRMKLNFQVPDDGSTAVEVLRKLHLCNRGNQINFDRFKVITSRRSGGNLNIIVLSDSWSANRIKKRLNWRPLYGNRRIRINVLGKKKKKPATMQPGEEKQPDNNTIKYLDELNEVEDDTFSESYDEL